MARRGVDDDDHDDDRDHDDDHDNNQKKHAAKMPNRKYAYFRDDQITFLVTHSESEITEDQLQIFVRDINRRLEPLGGGIVKGPPQVITFPKFTAAELRQSKRLLPDKEAERLGRAFSMIKCDLDGAPENPARLLEIVEELNEPGQQDLRGSIGELKEQGASVNWLTSIASQSGGTGGPGGKPSPYYGNRKTAPYRLDIKKQLEEAKGGDIYGDGSGVDVVILDTAPCAQDLVVAYKEWPDHPLISTLLGPNGKLHLYPMSYEEGLRLTCTSLNDHDYKMTDHGLFIAGMIHSIVPNARIHLIEVLNQFGVGDLTSFVAGLLKIYTEKIYDINHALAINCSWVLDTPRGELHCRHTDQIGDRDAGFEQAVLDFTKKDKTLAYLLSFLFHRFYGLGRQAIAAAGNDGRAGDTERPPARYPAALQRVKGIGAAPKKWEQLNTGKFRTSVFSNLSESPDKKGVVTRGVVTLGGEEDEGKGVLGLYIGEFPGCCRNESKWAWWSGTSFATPILTAAVASVLSRPANNITTTQEAIKKLYAPGVKIIKDGRAAKQEDALIVTQS
jgi:hypothetical protein